MREDSSLESSSGGGIFHRRPDGAMMRSRSGGSGLFLPNATQSEHRAKYEVLRVVNRGGMGEIALGRVRGSKGFEKLVVLKRLRADAEREDHVAMFDVEQEVMSRIEHPNIVKVFDQPVIDGVPYLAMEYVRGRNLDQIIRGAQQRGESLSPQFCLSAIAEVLRGLAFVHRLKDDDGQALGVVHQDMTPSNVMVSFFGEVKITDFGISYVTSRDGGLRKGVLKGKPRYVAPEVLAGKRVNNTADIYGVGVVLYEILTSRALFARPSVKDTLAAVAKNELPNFQAELGHLGEGIAQILDRSLKKDPQDRYRTAEAMAADVLNELAKRGGPLPAAAIGYHVRRYFADEPDVPETDPALEQAFAETQMPAALTPVDLDRTLQELDRLMGKDSSVDLFSVPPDLAEDLRELVDMDPFQARTPLPDFVWGARNEADLLARADSAFGPAAGLLEPPPLFPKSPPASVLEAPRISNPPALPSFPASRSSRDILTPSLGTPLIDTERRIPEQLVLKPEARPEDRRPLAPTPGTGLRAAAIEVGPHNRADARPDPRSDPHDGEPRRVEAPKLEPRPERVERVERIERIERVPERITERQVPERLTPALGTPLTAVPLPERPNSGLVAPVPARTPDTDIRRARSLPDRPIAQPRSGFSFWLGLLLGMAIGAVIGAFAWSRFMAG